MPPGAGKKLLRCSISSPVYVALVEEATQRHVDVGHVVEGRLQGAPLPSASDPMVVVTRLDQLAQQITEVVQRQEAMLEVLDALVTAVSGKTQETEASADSTVPIATYDQLYPGLSGERQGAPVAEEPVAKPRGGWRFFSS